MRKIYFHIGYPRSGSTYIQKNYFSSQKKKINFISRKFNYGNEDYFFYQTLYKIVKFNKKKFSKNLKKICQDFKKIKLDPKKINIISEELVLCQSVWNNNNVYRTLERLIIILKKSRMSPKFIIVIRNQEDLLLSYYKYFFSNYFFIKRINFHKMIRKKEYLKQFDFFNLAIFFKKKKIQFNFFLFEDLVENEKKFEKNLYRYLGIKKNNKKFFKDKSYKIINSKNYLHKYFISISFWFKSQKSLNIFHFLSLINKIICRIFRDQKIKNLDITKDQKKFINSYYYKSNLKLKSLINIKKIYLKNNNVD